MAASTRIEPVSDTIAGATLDASAARREFRATRARVGDREGRRLHPHPAPQGMARGSGFDLRGQALLLTGPGTGTASVQRITALRLDAVRDRSRVPYPFPTPFPQPHPLPVPLPFSPLGAVMALEPSSHFDQARACFRAVTATSSSSPRAP